MAVRILVDGSDAGELEAAVRAALGGRPESDPWVISLVKNQPLWSVNVLVSPENRLWGWNYLGLGRDIPAALADALRTAGLREPGRRGTTRTSTL